MVKMKHLKAYERNSCPDHVVQEVDDLMAKLLDAIGPILGGRDANIILSAFNRLHASMIVALISAKKEEIINATHQEVKGLIGNVEDISNIEIFPKN